MIPRGTAGPAGDDPRRSALVVAVSTYRDPQLRRLRSPAEDAADLSGVLADPSLGDFAVTTVTDETAHATRIAIDAFLAMQRTGDLMLLYLSCHGLVDARRRLYFAATDTLKDRLAATGVEARWLLDQLEECRARRQVVILDCCFSGAFAAGAKGDAEVELGDRLLGEGRGRVVLTASRGTEYSFEGEPTAEASAIGSVFTSALIAGIRTGAADRDDDGWITVDDAYAYAFDEMRSAGAGQTPQRWLYGAEGGIVLARSPATVEDAPIPTVPIERPTTDPSPIGGGSPPVRHVRPRTKIITAACAVGVLGLGAVAYIALTPNDSEEFSFESGVVDTNAPWRLHIIDKGGANDTGCTVTLTDLDTDVDNVIPDSVVYYRSMWQIQQTGRIKLEANNDALCDVTAEKGAGDESYPVTITVGDSPGFNPSGTVKVTANPNLLNEDDSCQVGLKDGVTGSLIDQVELTTDQPSVQIEPGDRSSVYLSNATCQVTASDT